jgi:hypothetical protein
MKKITGILVLAVFLFFGKQLQAAPITIQISGTITSASGASLPSSIHQGTTFMGTYTYESSAFDSDTNPNQGMYQYDSPYGISIILGGYEFKTSSNHVGEFDIIIKNDVTMDGVVDYYTVFSTSQSIPSIDFTPGSIIWNLRDSDHTALYSDILPIAAPTLNDWNYNNLSIRAFDSLGYGISIYGTVTQVELVPEPLTGFLLVTGIFFLQRKR